jgi:hypothetical protein
MRLNSNLLHLNNHKGIVQEVQYYKTKSAEFFWELQMNDGSGLQEKSLDLS